MVLFNTKAKVRSTMILKTATSMNNSNRRIKMMKIPTILSLKRSSSAVKRKIRKQTHLRIRISSTSWQISKSRKAWISLNMINLDSTKTTRMSNNSLQILAISKALRPSMPVLNNWPMHRKCRLYKLSKVGVLISIKRLSKWTPMKRKFLSVSRMK